MIASLPLPEGELFCKTAEDACLQRLMASPSAVATVLRENAVLADRYRTFIAMKDFAPLARPSLTEPYRPYSYLVKGNRLVMMDALEREAGEGIRRLTDSVEKLRYQLGREDSVVGKAIYLLLLSEQLDVLSLMLHQSGYDHVPGVAPLTAWERDYTRPLAREFAMLHALHRSLDRSANFFSEEDPAPGWMVRAPFKPNMSSNAMLPIYLPSIERSRLEPAAYARSVATRKVPVVAESWIRNSTGTVLSGLASPDYEIYVAAAYDVTAKIGLFNQLVALKGESDDLSRFSNPLSSSGEAVFWSEARTRLCLDGPLIDGRGFRCLAVSL